MDATSGAICGKRQASSLELLDTQQAEPVQSQPLPTPAHISTASEATLRSSMAAAAAFSTVSQTFSAPYDVSAVQHPLFTRAGTHPHVHMSYNTQAPSSSYLSASQMVHVPGTASAMPYFPGTLPQPSNGHNQPSPFFHPFLFNTNTPPASSMMAPEMPNPAALQLQIQSLQQQLQANQEELLRLKAKDTPMAPSRSASTARGAEPSHHGTSTGKRIDDLIHGGEEHEQSMELPDNERTNRHHHCRSPNKRMLTRSRSSVKNMSTSSSLTPRSSFGRHLSIYEKMRFLEAQVAKMRHQQEDSDDTDSEAEPLHPSLKALVVPPSMKMYKEKYDGQMDPSDHIALFVSHYDMHGIND